MGRRYLSIRNVIYAKSSTIQTVYTYQKTMRIIGYVVLNRRKTKAYIV
jgi:hypothetical protein